MKTLRQYLSAMMMNARPIILNTETGERRILPSPVMLHIKGRNPIADLEDGKPVKLFFYENFEDLEYKARLEQSPMPDQMKEDLKASLFLKQDLSRCYIGYLHADFDKKTYSIPEDQADKAGELKLLGDMFFSRMKG